ncbi:N-alpha-acetyltransferase 60 [Polyplax serrata]|uniref:N-alpha-acetyltransferase 60 n=1 Tax=Polyplax serrata TaxID=468196 RepID=A0ABR1B3S5_POLSC
MLNIRKADAFDIGLTLSAVAGFVARHQGSTKVSGSGDRGILSMPLNPKNTEAGYILSLGVSAPHRRNGIASLLLDNLIAHLTTVEHKFCRAIFLHVLTTNTPAIRFYESRNFKLQSFLPYYYLIKGRCKDGFTYVLYINGGHPPWGPCEYLMHYCKALCNSQPFA